MIAMRRHILTMQNLQYKDPMVDTKGFFIKSGLWTYIDFFEL